jgi:hypothetical protein
VRLHFPSGWELSEAQRSEAKALLVELETTINGTRLGPQNTAKARLTLLTKMLLGYPVADDASEAAAAARLDLYDDAIPCGLLSLLHLASSSAVWRRLRLHSTCL